jgi:hypothetical protein
MAPSSDLCGRMDSIREGGAFSYIPARHPGQALDFYEYWNLLDGDQEARYLVVVREGVVISCSCDDKKFRNRACKHMALLAEELIDQRTVQAVELTTPVPAPTIQPRKYHTFPAGAELIAYEGGYLAIADLAGSRQGRHFYMDADPMNGRWIETRRESMVEIQARTAAKPARTFVTDALDASFWK